MQSYPAAESPRGGWGQYLIRFLGNDRHTEQRPENTSFENCMLYENSRVWVDNRAMAGRSVRTFLAEGRMQEILDTVQEGDLVLMQFGHNDANRAKQERFAEPERFYELLRDQMVSPVRNRGGISVLVTPIAMRVFSQDGKCEISFPEYREQMLRLSEDEKLALVDLGKKTADLNTKVGQEACKSIYLWLPEGKYGFFPQGSSDDAHLKTQGALCYAHLAAEGLNETGLLRQLNV